MTIPNKNTENQNSNYTNIEINSSHQWNCTLLIDIKYFKHLEFKFIQNIMKPDISS